MSSSDDTSERGGADPGHAARSGDHAANPRGREFAAGSVALITGAARGIGRAAAIAFAARGVRVAVHYRADRDAALTTLRSLAGDGHEVFDADLADPAAARSLIERVVGAMGRLDILVNNAGIYELHAIAELDAAAWQAMWERTLAVNLLGPVVLVHAALPHLGRGARIVNVSSRGAFRGEPGAPAYGAAKAGLNSFGQSMAQALAPRGIAVCTLAPGFVETDMARELLEAPGGDAIRAQSPLGRVGTPEEIAEAIVFLASPDAEYMTGCIVDMNGASYLRS